MFWFLNKAYNSYGTDDAFEISWLFICMVTFIVSNIMRWYVPTWFFTRCIQDTEFLPNTEANKAKNAFIVLQAYLMADALIQRKRVYRRPLILNITHKYAEVLIDGMNTGFDERIFYGLLNAEMINPNYFISLLDRVTMNK